MEQIICSPYIAFKKIIELIPSTLNSQLGIKGGVINIPVEVNEMLATLPRSFKEMEVIQLSLKRQISSECSYKCEVIRPAYICDALEVLRKTPLYENIDIDQKYLDRYEKDHSKKLAFIVDDDDEVAVREILNHNELSIGKEDIINDEEENYGDDEVLLSIPKIPFEVIKTESNISSITIAPGEGKRPIPSYAIDNIDEYCLPAIYGGHKIDSENRLSYLDRIRYELRNVDPRHRNVTRILHMADRYLEHQIYSITNIQIRKLQKNLNLTVKDVKCKETLKEIVDNNRGYIDYRFTKQCRNSPAFWEARKSDLIAMMQQKGTPNIFLTLSLTETKNPELLALLYKNAGKGIINVNDALRLDENIKTQLIKNDPVTVVRYFEETLLKFKQIFQDSNGPFFENYVVDYYIRKEFQNRGSVHAHLLLWLKNSPIYQFDGSNDILIQFIDKIIKCKYNPTNPLMAFQRHKHTHTCYKGKLKRKICRFNYPKYVMKQTMILEPLLQQNVDTLEEWIRIKQNLHKINEQMNMLYKLNSHFEDEEILNQMCISETDYILAIRTTIKVPTVFLKRSSLEVAINPYNEHVHNLLQSNMDIQFILHPYGCIAYITDYINKGNYTLSKLLREVEKNMDQGDFSAQQKLQKYANELRNGCMITAQEAVYMILYLPLSECSVASIYIRALHGYQFYYPIPTRTKRIVSAPDPSRPLDLNSNPCPSISRFIENLENKYAIRFCHNYFLPSFSFKL